MRAAQIIEQLLESESGSYAIFGPGIISSGLYARSLKQAVQRMRELRLLPRNNEAASNKLYDQFMVLRSVHGELSVRGIKWYLDPQSLKDALEFLDVAPDTGYFTQVDAAGKTHSKSLDALTNPEHGKKKGKWKGKRLSVDEVPQAHPETRSYAFNAFQRVRPPRAYIGLHPNAHKRRIVIRHVEPDSPAEKAGLRRRDVIRGYELKNRIYPLGTQTDWALFLENLRPGETYTLIVRHDSKNRLVNLIPAAIPEEQPTADFSASWHV